MRVYRIIADLLIMASSTLLIGILAFDKLSNTDNQLVTNIVLQSMHLFFLIGAGLNVLHQFKNKQYFYFLLTLMPLFFFLIAIAGLFIGFQFPVVLLLVFDFYVIYWFFYLFLHDTDHQTFR
jgi:hypothetical protein